MLSKERQAATTAIVALQNSGLGATGQDSVNPRSPSHYGKERTLRIIASLGIQHIIFARISEPRGDSGDHNGPDREIDRLASSLQSMGCTCVKLRQIYRNIGELLHSAQSMLERRSVLLLEPHRLLAATPAFYGRMLRFGFATGTTLIGSPPIPRSRGSESPRDDESDLAVEVIGIQPQTIDVWNGEASLSLSRGGCYLLEKDFWEFFAGTACIPGEDTFDLALRSTPGVIAYIHATSGIEAASDGYNNVSGPTRIVRAPFANRGPQRWRVVASGQNP